MIGRIEKLPFADESFDLIVSNAVFDTNSYHSQDQAEMVKEIARVLKQAGIYYANLNWQEVSSFQDYFELIENVGEVPGISIWKKRTT